jgi:hypothetical protein
MGKFGKTMMGLVAVVVVVGGCSAMVARPTSTTGTIPALSPAASVSVGVPTAAVAPVPASTETSGQRNAVRSAKSYLDYTAFSKKGLVKQLKFEKYSDADANYAVEHITVDWMAQAAKSAKNYLEYTAFSKDGLIKQLKFEGFTDAEAKHGAESAF